MAADFGKDFLIRIDEVLASKLEMRMQNTEQEVSHSEFRAHAFRGSLPMLIADSVVTAARDTGLEANPKATTPAGYHYAEILTPSFVVSSRHADSKWWQDAKYSQELAQLNNVINPYTLDLFEDTRGKEFTDKLFVLISASIDSRLLENTQIHFEIPFPSLRGRFSRVLLEDLLSVANEGIRRDELDPVPFLKKRLDEIERDNQEA